MSNRGRHGQKGNTPNSCYTSSSGPLSTDRDQLCLFFLQKRSEAFTRIQTHDKTQPPRSLTKTRSTSTPKSTRKTTIPGPLNDSFLFLYFTVTEHAPSNGSKL